MTTATKIVDLTRFRAEWDAFTTEVMAAAEEVAKRTACVKCGKARTIAAYTEKTYRIKVTAEEVTIRFEFGAYDDSPVDWFRIVSNDHPRETLGWVCRECSPAVPKPKTPEATA